MIRVLITIKTKLAFINLDNSFTRLLSCETQITTSGAPQTACPITEYIERANIELSSD